MDKIQIGTLKKQVDNFEHTKMGEVAPSELQNIISEIKSNVALDEAGEANLSLMLILGIALSKAGNYAEACTYLESGCQMITDPKQDRMKKEFVVNLIKNGELMMQNDKKMKSKGVETITKYREVLIDQYERNEKWENFFAEVYS